MAGLAMSTVPQHLAEALEARQMSGNGLEVAAKTSRGYVSRFLKKTNVRVSPDTLRRFADVLRINYEEAWI